MATSDAQVRREKHYAMISPPGSKTPIEKQIEQAVQIALFQQMVQAEMPAAIGVCLSYLLHAIDRDPSMVRRLLSTPITKDGVGSTTILGLINHVVI